MCFCIYKTPGLLGIVSLASSVLCSLVFCPGYLFLDYFGKKIFHSLPRYTSLCWACFPSCRWLYTNTQKGYASQCFLWTRIYQRVNYFWGILCLTGQMLKYKRLNHLVYRQCIYNLIKFWQFFIPGKIFALARYPVCDTVSWLTIDSQFTKNLKSWRINIFTYGRNRDTTQFKAI